jgi:hypothetical protein
VNDRPQTELGYDARLRLHLLKLLEDGPRDLRFLVGQALGAYPTDVLSNLRELQRTGEAKEIDTSVWASLAPTAQGDHTPLPTDESLHEEDSGFPEPHPLDFDWRFDKLALEHLENRIEAASAKSIAVLGAPTLFKYLREHQRAAHLFDRNEQIVSFLKRAGHTEVTHCDLFHYSGRSHFDCVIADPPWYLDHYQAFIEAARHMLAQGRKLFLSVLPPLTRPSAEKDRSAVATFASDRGFDLIGTEPGLLGYLSPPFELEALKSEGMNVFAWRSGDLYTFVLSDRGVSKYTPVHTEQEHHWKTFAIGRTVVKVKWDGAHLAGSFDFDTVSEMRDIRLRSVSRRSPVRSKINLWTSRNIALHVSRPDLTCAALQLLVEGRQSAEVARTLKEVKQLSPIELDRLVQLLGILIEESKN